MWIPIVLVASFFGWKYRSKLLPGMFHGDPYPISGGWNPAAVDILFQTVAGLPRGINPQFSDWLLHGSQGGGHAFNKFLVDAGEQRGPSGHAMLATDWITDAYQDFPTQMAIIKSQFPDVAALINSAVNGAQPSGRGR